MYFEDAYLREFDARVISCRPAGKLYEVVLDQSAFFPEGGGQPADTGTLGDVKVLDVQEKDQIPVHMTDAPLAEGQEVHGTICWKDRFSRMQEHSGEHIVSGLIHRKYGYDNVGFHMGEEIRLDISGVLTWEELMEIEQEANGIVFRNLPLHVWYPGEEELHATDYRSKKELSGAVRIVEFPGTDICACCGTHVARTGEIGLVRILSVEKFHSGVRVEMAAGRRAYEYLSDIADQNRQVSRILSAKPLETARAVERMQGELAQVKQEKAAWEGRYIAARAQALKGMEHVTLFEEGLSPDSLRRLCVELMEGCGGRCAVFSGSDETGWAYALGQTGGDLRQFVKELNAALNGRGGGKPNFAQGRVSAKRSEIEAYLVGR